MDCNKTSNICVQSKPFIYNGKYNEIFGREESNEYLVKLEKNNDLSSNSSNTNNSSNSKPSSDMEKNIKNINFNKYGSFFGRSDDDMPDCGYRMSARLNNPDI